MKKNIVFIILFFLFSFSKVNAVEYFYDDFNQEDTTKWNYMQTWAGVNYTDGVLNLGKDTSTVHYPMVVSNIQNIFPQDKDWKLNVKFKYSYTGAFGDGIGIGFTGPDYHYYYQFGIWNDWWNNAHFYYNDFNGRTNGCTDFTNVVDTDDRQYLFGLSFADGNWHDFKIEKINDFYRVYMDDIQIYTTSNNQCVPTHLWFGNILAVGYARWSLLSIDEVKIYDDTVVQKPKIIILPGLGASWNTNAIVYNQTVGDNDWKMTPFVKNYNGLINALKENGLEENKDFYVWNYDWRRPISEIENKLNSFINEKIGNDEKVILIGHSLGGLVSRIWAEDNKNDSRLEKVIDLAAPNLGSVNSYEVWNGGQISNLNNFSSIAFKILLKIQGLKAKTDMEAARNYAPVLKDLLPTFNFITKSGNVLTNDKLETKNSYLLGKNNVIDIGSTLKLFAGNGFNTAESIILKDNSIFDKVLGIWPDGKINKINYSTNGDGMVLVKSANYGKDNFVEISSNHGEIVDKTISQVMTEIGLSQVDALGETQSLDNNLVFFVGSPVSYSVKCDSENSIADVDGFVVIKNNNYRLCEINLNGIGDGLIHVVTGNTNDNNWFYWEKNIKNGENYIVKINPNDGQIINDKNNISLLKSIIKDDLNSLIILNKNNKNLKEALKFLDKDQPRMVIRNIFEFRKGNDERFISEKIIDNTVVWMSLVTRCSSKEANFGFKIVNNYQNLINNLVTQKSKKYLKVSENGAISYQKMDELLKMTKIDLGNKDYTSICANNLAALNYGNEVLIKSFSKDDFKKWLLQDSNL